MSAVTEIRNPKSEIRNVFWLAVWSLASRELVRFFAAANARDRRAGATGAVLGAVRGGAARQFQSSGLGAGDMTYQEYFFPGVAVLIVLFTAIFSTISIIEDRREGFLQGVLVAPISRLAIVLGKLCGGAALAVVQAGLFLALAPLLGLSMSLVAVLEVLAFLMPPGLCHDGPGISDCLAARFDAGLSCDHERVSDADVAFVGGIFPGRRIGLAELGDPRQPA